MSGILALQSDVARKVASALALKLLPAEKTRLASARSVNPEAYEAYLKGSQYWIKMTKGGLDTAQGYFDMALQKEPDFAKAWAGLAWVWAVRNQMGYTPPSEAVPKEREAVLKAVALDDTLAEAHYALAVCKAWGELDPPAAGPEFERAVQLDPNDPNGVAMYSHYLAIMGHADEAMRQIDRAVSLDPFNVTIHSFRAMDLVFARRYDEAIAEARKALGMEPGNPVALTAEGLALVGTERYKQALPAIKEAYTQIYGLRDLDAVMARGFSEGGFEEAMRRGAGALSALAARGEALPTDVAVLYVCAGDKSRALDWLEKGYEVRDPGLPYVGAYPFCDPLRAEPRFQVLLRKMGLPTTPPTGTPRAAGASS
jgi:adenylate cyclase